MIQHFKDGNMNSRTREFRYNDSKGQTREFDLEAVPELFLATNDDEVHDAIVKDGADISEVFQGYNALQWHCDAATTSPSLIGALIGYGIDIDALDQRKLPLNPHAKNPPIARRTALGYACCNGNVKAVRTLLLLGADPGGSSGPLETPFGSLQLGGQDDSTIRPTYPTPLQDLLSQQFGGPTGFCPFSIHLKDGHATADDSDDDVPLAYHIGSQGIARMYGLDAVQPECDHCSVGFDVHEAECTSADELQSIASRAQQIYAKQMDLASMRVMKCGRLLLKYMHPDRVAGQLAEGHDANLPSPIDCLLRSVWYFLGPTMLCWRDRFAARFHWLDPATLSRKELVQFAAQDPSVLVPDLSPWANLVVQASRASLYAPGLGFSQRLHEYRGVDRLLALLGDHPSLDQFPEGRFADVTFCILAVGLRKPSTPPRLRPVVITIKKREVKKEEEDANGDPVLLPEELSK